jgi:hypothetical protein
MLGGVSYEIELLVKLAEFSVGLVVTLAETVNKTMSNITTKITSYQITYQPYQMHQKYQHMTLPLEVVTNHHWKQHHWNFQYSLPDY